MLTKLCALWRKETLSLIRDFHGLMVLFLMPTMFILVMSFALKDAFNPQKHAQLDVAIIQTGTDSEAQGFYQYLISQKNIWQLNTQYKTLNEAKKAILARQLHAVIVVSPNPNESTVPLFIDSGLSPMQQQLIESRLMGVVGEHRAQVWIKQLNAALPLGGDNNSADKSDFKKLITINSVGSKPSKPNSTQQSVPAWLVFALFFIVIPISNVFITERDQGTLTRLKSLGIHPGFLLLGKFLPYFIVNQLQTIVLLCLGRYIMPLLGADPFLLDFDWFAVAALSSGLSCSAIGWSLLVAVNVRSTQQASVIGGTSNMLMAAIGGIMVPKFIMPTELRYLSQYSPMNWGLEGFHNIILYHGGIQQISHYLALLFGFGGVCFVLATLLLYKQRLNT